MHHDSIRCSLALALAILFGACTVGEGVEEESDLSPTDTIQVESATLSQNAFKGGNKNSIAIVEPGPHYYTDQITFDIEVSFSQNPWVRNTCYQNGEVVLITTHGMFEGYIVEPIFYLGPTIKWTGGDADCVAELTYRGRNGSFRTKAKIEYQVLAGDRTCCFGCVEDHMQIWPYNSTFACYDESEGSWMY